MYAVALVLNLLQLLSDSWSSQGLPSGQLAQPEVKNEENSGNLGEKVNNEKMKKL